MWHFQSVLIKSYLLNSKSCTKLRSYCKRIRLNHSKWQWNLFGLKICKLTWSGLEKYFPPCKLGKISLQHDRFPYAFLYFSIKITKFPGKDLQSSRFFPAVMTRRMDMGFLVLLLRIYLIILNRKICKPLTIVT